MGWHVPFDAPALLSQTLPAMHVSLCVQVPPLQIRVTACAFPLQASVPAAVHGQPSTATAPVPMARHASPPPVPPPPLPFMPPLPVMPAPPARPALPPLPASPPGPTPPPTPPLPPAPRPPSPAAPIVPPRFPA